MAQRVATSPNLISRRWEVYFANGNGTRNRLTRLALPLGYHRFRALKALPAIKWTITGRVSFPIPE